jgi:superfamily II DNA/RNA helicase
VLGIAQTGTGKTGAFTLPILHRMSKGRARARMPRCLIVCPTRELAAQVAENVELYGKYLKISMALLIGGVSFTEQEMKLNRGVDVLIATPGRLLDQFERGKILLTGVQALVVDEADRMLDMGFIPDIERIFKLTPFTRQVLFFSATMPSEIQRIVDQFLHQPERIQIARENTTAKTVHQQIVRMPSNDSKQKRTALRHVIDDQKVKNGIIFCNRKRDVDIVAKSLSVHGHSAAPIHGDLPQSVRTQTLEAFKTGEVHFLVASDVAARGLDIPAVSHVLNFDVPSHSEDYVHRIGRTGRAGLKGDAIMFVTPGDRKYYDAILKLIQVKEIEEFTIPGLEDFETTNSRHKRDGRDNKKNSGRGRDRDRGRRNNNSRSSSQNKDASAPQTKKPDNREPKKQVQKQDQNQVQKQDQKQENRAPREPSHKPKPNEAKKDNNRSKRGALPRNKHSGFGDSAPAFFGAGLKK